MRLSPGQLVGYDDARRVFIFTMPTRPRRFACSMPTGGFNSRQVLNRRTLRVRNAGNYVPDLRGVCKFDQLNDFSILDRQ